MSNVGVWVKLEINPGMRDEAVAVIQEALDAVQAEEGTLLYVLNADPENENVLYFYEAYANQDALIAHGSAPWFAAFGPKLKPVLAARPSMTFLTPLGGKGL
jgi:quinol monooxygenase YgiN